MTKEYVMKRLKLLIEHKGVQTFNYDEAKIVLEEIERLNNIINKKNEEIERLKKELHALEISEEQWLEETLGSDKE